MDIDDGLYSRQRYVLGDSAMQRMARSNVLVSGMGGVGIEIAKNIALAGIKALTVHDTQVATVADLGTQFFLTEKDVGSNRAEASVASLAELNPYVAVGAATAPLDVEAGKDFLAQFQCIILTDATEDVVRSVDEFCRSQSPAIGFICANVRGLFAMLFVDFGDSFDVVDATGEDLKETYISGVSKAADGLVTTIDNHMHNLEDGDRVTFREVEGMAQLNDAQFTVKVVTPYTFTIGDTSGFDEYAKSGVVCQLQRKRTMSFQSYADQMSNPSLLLADYAKMEHPMQTLLGFRAFSAFVAKHGQAPQPWDAAHAQDFIQMAEAANAAAAVKVDAVNKDVLTLFSYTCAGVVAPLCAAVGGWAAQEALKALTGKFSPLNQILCFDAAELAPGLDTDAAGFQPKGDRYDYQRICIGEDLCSKLQALKLFMVGCGAIGCEMLKNYALLGVGAAATGRITITDNDLIEKSNLNRQFLFRPHHIQCHKSTTGAQAACDINGALNIEAHQHKVGPETAKTVYSDEFFAAQDLVVNALDNVQARLFMDACCVRNQRPLLESGTMGAKGHVQVIVPHVTESYASQRDPPDTEVPYCTLKSFPSTIEHTIQWARDKFANLFELKPADYNKFWSTVNNAEGAAAACRSADAHKTMARVAHVVKLATTRPFTWPGCLHFARAKFEKYFNHKARHLLLAFPIGTKLQDGSLFWQSPKRPPQPLVFDATNPNHLSFVLSTARLVATRHHLQLTAEDTAEATVLVHLETAAIPAFVPKAGQKIVTDEAVKKEGATKKPEAEADFASYAAALERLAETFSGHTTTLEATLDAVIFEKDDDRNGHIDFITATSNLRALMYAIQPTDRFKTKLIAGKIVPAIATTTAAISGLVSLELMKVVKGVAVEDYKNVFLNLALPFMLLTEPGAPEKTTLVNGMSFTLWDQWEVKGNPEMTLQMFMDCLKEQYSIVPSGIFNGGSMVYVPMFPGQQKRLTKLMKKLLKPPKGTKYIDLVITLAPEDTEIEDEPVPPVRYWFK